VFVAHNVFSGCCLSAFIKAFDRLIDIVRIDAHREAEFQK